MTKSTVSYSDLQSQLQSIIDDLQTGELDIDQAIDKYKQAQAIVARLEKQLKQAENTIKKISNQQG